MVKGFLFLIMLVLSWGDSFSQIITARAYSDKTTYEVGDYIYYSIEISSEQDLVVFKPALAELVKDMDVISSEEPIVEDKNGSKKILYRFIVSKYDSADVIIPSIPVSYQIGTDTTSFQVFTNPIEFAVRTVPVVTAAEIKDVKPPILIPLPLWLMLLIGVLVLTAILLGWYFYRKNQKKKLLQTKKKRIYIIPPHVKALSDLHELSEKKLWQQGLIKEYHSNITEIIRRYFEDRFHILALESTTTEIMQQLTRVVLPENIYQTVNDFLTNADLVKFAKYKPLPKVNEEMMSQAIDIVENTVPVTTNNQNMEKVNVQ
jgi:hypothetical protein